MFCAYSFWKVNWVKLKQCFINFSQNITFQLTRSSSLLFTLSCCAYWYPTNTKCSLGTNISTILRKGIFLRDDNQFSSKLSRLFVTKLNRNKIISSTEKHNRISKQNRNQKTNVHPIIKYFLSVFLIQTQQKIRF